MQFWKSLNELSLQASPPVCPKMEQFYSLDIYGQYSTYIPYTWPTTLPTDLPASSIQSWILASWLPAVELNSLDQRE